MNRRAAREAALMALFQVDLGHTSQDSAMKFAMEESGIDEVDEIVSFFRSLVTGVIEKKTDIDAVLARYAIGWHIDRMASVDRNILRMAVYEIGFADPRQPIGVALNEAVELAKVYGDDESGKFINGVLANVVKGLQLIGKL